MLQFWLHSNFRLTKVLMIPYECKLLKRLQYCLDTELTESLRALNIDKGKSQHTFLEFAHSKHAVAGRQVPYTQGLVITHSGTHREVGMRGQTPDFSLHMTLANQNR